MRDDRWPASNGKPRKFFNICLAGQASTPIGSCVTVPGSQVSGSLTNARISPANVYLTGQTSTAPGACVTIDGSQITGNLTNSNISPANVCLPGQANTALGSCATVTGDQVTSGEIPSTVTFNGTLGTNSCPSVLTCFQSSLANSVPNCVLGIGSVYTSLCTGVYLGTWNSPCYH